MSEKTYLFQRQQRGQCGWDRVTGQVVGSAVSGMRVKILLHLEGHCRGKGHCRDFDFYSE